MTNKEAMDTLASIRKYLCSGNPIWNTEIISEAVDMAIDALCSNGSQRNCTNCKYKDVEGWEEPCLMCGGFDLYEPQTERSSE